MKLEQRIAHGSGSSRNECHYIGHRYQADLGPQLVEMDSWLIGVRGQRHDVELHVPGWLNGVYRFPSGRVMVTHENGNVYFRSDPNRLGGSDPMLDGSGWTVTSLNASLRGIWGLGEDLVFVWGTTHQGRPFLMQWNQGHWHELKAPTPILAMHGRQENLIFAVGDRGTVTRFDGEKLIRLPSPTEAALWDVTVVSEEEVYACGPRAPLLLGSFREWEILFPHYAEPQCIAHHEGRTWFGTPMGLFELRDGEPLLVREDLLPVGFDHRDELIADQVHHDERIPGELLVVCANCIASTTDGISFPRFGLRPFVKLTHETPIPWVVADEEPDVQDDLHDEWDPDEDEDENED